MSDEDRNRPTVQLRLTGSAPRRARRVRWWPLLLFLAAAAGFVAWTWYDGELQRQQQVIRTAGAGAITVLLILVWCLLLSGLRWSLRLLGAGLILSVMGFLAASLQLTSFTGDMVPILEWRWNVALEEALPPAPVVNTNRPAAGYFTADFPQYFGPARDGRLDTPKLARNWSAAPPELLWRRPVGEGWSGFAVSGDRAVTMEQHGPDEVITCYHLLTGEQIWTNAYPARYESPPGGVGPRTVPLIVSNRVYALGATGFLNCLDLDTGQSLWLKDILEENSASVPEWGVAGSPLHHDGKIIVNPGGTGGRSLVAYAATSGEIVWSGGDAPCSYGSPALLTLAGVEQIVMFNQPSILSHDPATGAVLWEHPWRGNQPRVALPVAVSPDTVLFSSGYGVGAELLRVTRPDSGGWTVEPVWRSIRMKAKFANMIRKDGFLFGLDDGILACLDLADGSQRWKEGRYGHGQMLLVGDLLLVTAENGEVVLLEPTPDAPNELSRFTAFDHKQWNPPALAGQLLLVRTHREAAAYVLPLLTEPASPGATAATATATTPDVPDSE